MKSESDDDNGEIVFKDSLNKYESAESEKKMAERITDFEDYYMIDDIKKQSRQARYKIQDFNYERDAHYVKIRGYLYGNKYDQVEKALLDFAERYPADKNYKEYHYYLGIVNENRGKYIKAVQNYSEAIRICPGYSRAWNNLGYLYSMMKQYNRAEKCFLKAIESNPYNPFIHYNAGNFYFGIGDYSNALRYLGYAVKYKANFGDSYNKIAIIMYKKKKYREAIENFEKAMIFKKESPIGYFYTGLSYYRLDKRDQAIESLKKAVEIKDDFFEAYLQLGKIYKSHGEYDNALGAYSRAEKYVPDYVQLKIWIAECYSAKGKYDTAIRIIQALIKKEPDNKDLLEMLEELKEAKYNRNLKQKNDYLNY